MLPGLPPSRVTPQTTGARDLDIPPPARTGTPPLFLLFLSESTTSPSPRPGPSLTQPETQTRNKHPL